MFRKRLRELEKIIEKADRDYYLLHGEAPPTLTDEEYTLYLSEWRALLKIDKDISSALIPGFVKDDVNIVEITEPMLSIYEYLDEEKFLSLKNRYPDHTLEKKYNGIEIRIVYNPSGKLERIHLRGDGKQGRDITYTQKLIRNIPKKISGVKGEYVHVTGEVICFIDDYEAYCDKLNITDRTPRNIVGWLLGRPEPAPKDDDATLSEEESAVLDLYFVAFHASKNVRKKCKTYPKLTAWLQKEKFDIPEPLDEFPSCLPPDPDFSIDGIVIKDNVLAHWDETEQTGYYRYCGAYKFPKNIKTTVLKSVVWGVTHNGLLRGTIRFHPVTFNGKTFDTCTFSYLHHHVKSHLSLGSKIELGYHDKTGLTFIGVVEKSLNDPIVLPTHCPYCQSPLFLFNKETYKCVEQETCQGQLTWRLQRTVSERGLNIPPIKASHIPDLIKENSLKSVNDLFRFTRGTIKGVNFSAGNVSRITKLLTTAPKETLLANWITAAGIYGLGEARAIALENALLDLETDIGPHIVLRLLTDTKRMYQLFGADAIKIVSYTHANYDEFLAFFKRFDFAAYNADNMKTTRPIITISGELPFRRSDFIERLTRLGYCCDYTVTRSSKYFLMADNIAVSKIALAKRYGIRVVSIAGMSIENIVTYLGLNE